MRSLIFVLLVFLGKFTVLAHDITLRDSVTNAPIFYATVCDADGNYIGRSDVNGNINNLQKGCAYHISHLCYGTKIFICDDQSSIVMSPQSYTMPEIVVTAKKKKYYHCKVFFRNVQYVDSCLKYYIDGVREFFIDIKSRKVKRGNAFCHLFQTTNKYITQKERAFMIGLNPGLPNFESESLYEKTLKDEGKRIEGNIVYGDSITIGRCEVYPDKKEVVLSCDQLYPKSYKKRDMFGYKYLRTEDNCTEVYNVEKTETPNIFNLKSYSSYQHIMFSLKKNFAWDYDCEDRFFVVEREYTDAMEPTSNEFMSRDYDKYSEMYPVDDKTRSLLAGMEQVNHFSVM